MSVNQNYFFQYFKSFLKVVRWPNLLILLFTQYLVFLFIVKNKEVALETWWPPFAFYVLSLSTLLIAAAGYIINDYYDIKIDLVNKPSRIVIGRIISRREALVLHSVFNFIAIVVGSLLSWKVALFFSFCAFLLWLYSNYFKRTPLIGNLIISLLTAASIWVISLYFKENDALILRYSLFAFLVSLLREVVKDMEDVKGDAAYGCRTLPIVLGVRKTKWILLAILAVALLLMVHYLFFDPRYHPSFYHNFLLLPLLYFGFRLILADKQRDYAHLSSVCKYLMIAGLVSLGFA